MLYINKGLWSSKKVKNLFILGKRPGSSSMFMPNKDSLKIYGFKEKDLNLFDNRDNAILLIEWPEIIEKKPNSFIKFHFEYKNDYKNRYKD